MLARLLVVALLIVLTVSGVMAEGKEIRVLLKTGEVVDAELLAVRDDALFVTTRTGVSDRRLAEDSTSIMRLPLAGLVRITVEGRSYVGIGALLGFPLGIVAGALIGSSAVEDDNSTAGRLFAESLGKPLGAMVGGLIGGVVGLGLGVAVGGAASERDQDIQPGQLEVLRGFARYTLREPDFLELRFAPSSMKVNGGE
jgi:hypothetical protein